MDINIVCALISLFTLFGYFDCASIKRRRSVTHSEAHDWLDNYGFMTAANPTDGDYTEAMILMQRYYGIQETGLLDQATEDMMLKPRCGIKDIDPDIVDCTEQEGTACRRRRFTTLGPVWDSTALTYRFNNYSPDLSRTQIQGALRRAFGVWAEVAPLSFTQIADGNSLQGRSDIEISFGPGNHGISHPADQAFDGPSFAGGTVLAHAFNPGSTLFRDLRGDMHFDEDELWQDGAGIDLFTVAAHEFGHSLGLGHSNVQGALMYPTYLGYDPNFQLHENDIQGIQSLYGVRQTAPDPTIPKVMSTVATTSPRTSTTMTTAEATTPEVMLDYCNTAFDSIATIENVFDDTHAVLFKMSSRTVGRFATDNAMVPEVFQNDVDPSSDVRMRFRPIWNESPISAVVQKADGSLVVIGESIFWEYDTTQSPIVPKANFPRPLTNLGIPNDAKIVAALSDRDQRSIYLFTGDMFWTYSENLIRIGRSPESISERWPGIPDDFDSVFNLQDDSYFVKGTEYWLFNETSSEVEAGYPRSFGDDWLGCGSSANMITVSVILSIICCIVDYILLK